MRSRSSLPTCPSSKRLASSQKLFDLWLRFLLQLYLDGSYEIVCIYTGQVRPRWSEIDAAVGAAGYRRNVVVDERVFVAWQQDRTEMDVWDDTIVLSHVDVQHKKGPTLGAGVWQALIFLRQRWSLILVFFSLFWIKSPIPNEYIRSLLRYLLFWSVCNVPGLCLLKKFVRYWRKWPWLRFRIRHQVPLRGVTPCLQLLFHHINHNHYLIHTLRVVL